MRAKRKSFFNTCLQPSCVIGLVIICFLNGCATYYQQNVTFNKQFESGDLKNALDALKQDQRQAKGKNKFLYYANQGLLLSILGKYAESNDYFEKAFLFGEDYRINYLHELGSYLYNPNLTTYRGEDHEHLMVLYYKAINFLKLNNPESALVECKRLVIRLNQLSDKYTSEQKYKRDAFIHNLMGIIYQSVKDYNNAFIAYRNAYEVYTESYKTLFQVEVPEQLKRDLLNTAYWTGFREEFDTYKQAFGLEDFVPQKPTAELVFFWHNGLSPVKDEWSINFAVDHQADNMVVFSNPMIPQSFRFKLEKDNEKNDLSKIEFFRVAFPKYVERSTYFQSATIQNQHQTYTLELAEDVNQIAFHSLKQRMVQEFSKGLLRVAIKKATEHSVRKDNDSWGALIGAFNAITEKADTRNWQTLPHDISYARVPLNVGANDLQFSLYSSFQQQPETYTFSYNVQKGQTLFHTFSSLETQGIRYK
jgi:hypothetical protein